MITDKDRAKAHIVVRMVANEIHGELFQKIGIKETEEKIACMFSKAAEEAREEAAGIAVKWVNKNLCDEHMPIMSKRLEEDELRAAILKEATE